MPRYLHVKYPMYCGWGYGDFPISDLHSAGVRTSRRNDGGRQIRGGQDLILLYTYCTTQHHQQNKVGRWTDWRIASFLTTALHSTYLRRFIPPPPGCHPKSPSSQVKVRVRPTDPFGSGNQPASQLARVCMYMDPVSCSRSKK